MGAEARGGVGYVLRKFPVLSETFILNELLALQERGVRLHVISLERPNDPRFHDDLPRLKARVNYLPSFDGWRRYARIHWRLLRSKAVGSRYRETFPYAVAHGGSHRLLRFLQAGYVANEVRRLKLDHLHAHFAHYPTSVARLAARMTGIPFSFTAHATDIFKHEVDRRDLVRKIDEARFVVTVSEFNREYLRSLDGAPPGKISLIRNGIDIRRFRPTSVGSSGAFRIICVARLVEKKGLSILVEACRLLKARGLDFRCDIVGKGRLRSALEAQISGAFLSDRVRLLGPKTQVEVRDHYRRSHAYVLPAIVGRDGNREGLPVSIVEALASGLPVVATPVAGIPEAVRDGQNGLLAPPNDAVALAAALEKLMGDPALYRRLQGKARASVESDYDRERTAGELHALLEGVEA